MTVYIIIGWIGILITLIDIPIKTSIAYPDFIPFATEAPNTVDMVINHVIGPVFTLDLLPDLIGYILIFISIAGLGPAKKYFYKQIPLLTAAMGLYAANTFLPFYLNGNERFRIGYLFYFLACIFKIIALFEYTFCYAKMGECRANHTYNTTTVILMMVSFLAGIIHYVLAFYQLTISSYIYYFVQLALLIYIAYRIWRHRSFLLESTL